MSQRHLGQYELQQRLTGDTLSEVWKAFDTLRRHYVLVNILHLNALTAPDIVARFLHETHHLKSLQHPNIVRVFDIQVTQGSDPMTSEASIVMEYVEGQTLADYLHATAHRGKFPSASDILSILAPLGAPPGMKTS